MPSDPAPACPLCGASNEQSVAAGGGEIDVATEAKRLYVECLDVMARARAREVAETTAALDKLSKREKAAVTAAATAIIRSDKTVLNAIRTAKPALELLANILGKLQPAMVLNLHASAEYVQLRGVIMGAIAPHRAAMLDMAQALDEHLRQREEVAHRQAQRQLAAPVTTLATATAEPADDEPRQQPPADEPWPASRDASEPDEPPHEPEPEPQPPTGPRYQATRKKPAAKGKASARLLQKLRTR